MVIRKIKIQNFKRFDDLEVEVRPFDCLVGPNNSGKTTLLQALALFDFCVHSSLRSKNGELEIKGRSIPPDEFYVLPVADPVDLWTDRKTQGGKKHVLIRVKLTFDEGSPVTAAVDLSYNRYKVSIVCEDESQNWLKRLKDFRISYLPVFSTFLPQEERRTPAVIEDSLARGRVNSVIRNLLLNLKSDGRDGDLIEVLRRIFGLASFSIDFDEVNDRYITVSYKEKNATKEFDVFSGGSGFQQFIYLFGFITLRQPTVILLDEPDAHLHGSLQRVLLGELDRLVDRGKQVLFATHSRDMISSMSPENILALEQGEPKRLSVAFDIYDTLDRLGSVESTQLPVLQTYRKVLVVEDKSDWNLLSLLCSKSLGLSVWQEVERRLAVCHAKGNPWKQDMDRLRQQLQQMLVAAGQPLEMYIVADRDYYPDLEMLIADLQNTNLYWHIWQRTEIENYLLSEDAMLRLFQEPGMQISMDEQELRLEFSKLVEQSRDSANDRLVKAFLEYSKKRAERWDPATLSRKAREYLQEHWEHEKLFLADAKEIVLPGMKRWFQESGLGQFSDMALAEAILNEKLPPEIHEVARRLANFAGVTV